jgi:hypothetical protein
MYELLVDAVKSSNENSKLSGLKAFNLLELAIDDKEIINLLKKQLKHRNPLIKAEAISILGKIMQKFPLAEDFKKDQTAKRLKNLIYDILYLPYQINVPLEVKTAICTFSTEILMNQPHIPYLQQIMGKIGMDHVPLLASRATETLFNWILKFPEKLEESTPLIRDIANNLIPEVNETLVKGIIRLKKQFSNIDGLLPTLSKLATSPIKEIRSQTLEAIGEFYVSEPEKFTFYFDLIVGLARNRIPEFRREAVKNIIKYLFQRPEFAEQSNQIFNTLQNLSRDTDYLIKFNISTNLKIMIATFPKRINEALFICYSFMRGSERDIKENTALAIKLIWKSYPNQKGQIMTNLQRYYRKSQDSVILTLMDELKMMDRGQKQPPAITQNEPKSEKSE